MVPADDEQEPEPTAPQITVGNKRPTTSADSTARLTPMPAWLMHWWTPLAIAEGLLRWPLTLAIFWGGQPHWPSSEAMKLCATIVGAGLAFSAWQQRSHDNVVKEKQAQAAIERDDYWKRREYIFQLLGSKNPGLRLSAVALLAELADSAAHSTLLNETEKQQLQRHIIDTLCQQVRHEGLPLEDEGTRTERAEIQRTIVDTLFRRISVSSFSTSHTANWSQETLELTNCRILAEITLDNVTSETIINLNNTEFDEKLRISGPKIGKIQWENTTFHKGLEIGNQNETTVLTFTNLPMRTTEAKYINTTFLSNKVSFIIDIEEGISDSHKLQTLTFEGCSFYNLQNCKCLPECTCENQNSSETCACSEIQQCSCSASCINSTVQITDLRAICTTPTEIPKLVFHQCRIGSIKANLTHFHLRLTVTENHIYNGATLNFFDQALLNDNIRYPDDSDIMIDFSRNLFITPAHSTKHKTTPFHINIHTAKVLQIPIRFIRNFITSSRNTDEVPETLLSFWGLRDKHPYSFHELTHSQPHCTSEQFDFIEHCYGEDRSYIGNWSTGRTTKQRPQ